MAMMRDASWFTMQAIYNGLQLLLAQEQEKEEPDDRFIQTLIEQMRGQRIIVYILDPPVTKEPAAETEPEADVEQPAPLSRIERIRRWFGM